MLVSTASCPQVEQEAEQKLKEQQKQVNAERCYDEWVARKAELGREKKKEEQKRIAQKITQDREVGDTCTHIYTDREVRDTCAHIHRYTHGNHMNTL